MPGGLGGGRGNRSGAAAWGMIMDDIYHASVRVTHGVNSFRQAKGMGGDRGRLILIDADECRRGQMQNVLRMLRMRVVLLPAIPSDRWPEQDIVFLAGSGSKNAVAAARIAFAGACIIVGGLTSEQAEAVHAFRAGADDFVWLGAGDDELLRVVESHLPQCETAPEAIDADSLVGNSAPTMSLRAFVRKIAPTDATVLITGESGTGKDVVATLIHRQSKRTGKSLVRAQLCRPIPDALIEGELFGYGARGILRGAHSVSRQASSLPMAAR